MQKMALYPMPSQVSKASVSQLVKLVIVKLVTDVGYYPLWLFKLDYTTNGQASQAYVVKFTLKVSSPSTP